jgi:hypothetical protein
LSLILTVVTLAFLLPIMRQFQENQDWLLLIHQLPPTPTNLRVRTWRKLQKLGAVPIKGSVYVLPFNDKTYEDFQWLKQEIESAGGEVAVFRAGSVEGATDAEIIGAFIKQRDDEYQALVTELGELMGAINEQKKSAHLPATRINSYEAELSKLHKEIERITAIDFFAAPGRTAAMAAYEKCNKALRESQSRNRSPAMSASGKGASLNLAKYQSRRWVTRHNLFIDRLASIWLIKRFIDKRPRFHFVADAQAVRGDTSVEGGISFDMYGAEFTHRGEDCTFETMIKEFGLDGDAGLREIGEIVHDIDLKDNKFNRSEAAGLQSIIRGLADLLKNDRKLVQQCFPIFDGLYELFGRGGEKALGVTDVGKRSRALKRIRRADRE